ncbi:alpha/beta hydrolase family protein [Erythrobacter sp. BLCC-B19]|uniref:alpha/beta hydrolase family protein n=1 Tax=Erythrobacter sp. BLCC-B19 TaxID=3025315 RepID=UPI002360C35A|nr:prolyl oligopeptidase family serine peptidase [Erythrobacter sp. BLCC-B19]WDA39884.1 prolyl oligopeptidase family serine peptidase [Erythrobacter sp. BLCC-B19]
MKLLKTSLAAALIGVSAIGLLIAAPAPTLAQGTVPVDVWALRDVVDQVQISPDGQHVLVHKVESREGEYILEIYRTDDLSKPLRRLNADPMEIVSGQWIGNDVIFGSAWQVNRKTVKGPEEDVRDYKTYSYSVSANKFTAVDGNFGIVNLLPNDPDHILVSTGTTVGDGTGVDPFAAFRPRSYYKYNLKTGARELVLRGGGKFPVVDRWDNEGNPRFTQSQDTAAGTVSSYYRLPGDSEWKKFQEFDLNDPKNLYRILGGFHGIVGFDPENPNIGYLIENPDGEDKAGLYEFDFTTGKIGKKLFQAQDADVMGIQLHSIPGNDKLVAARYPGEKMERFWFDEEEKALYQALEQQIPYAWQVSIASRSLDGKSMIVTNRGPRDPGSFWLVKDGKLAKLGSRNPLVNPEQLSDVKYIRYKARDGLEIPAWVTIPKGKGPFPLIVQHNGGPHVNGMVGYDEWGQMLANAGYMVLHPDNRISVGWGQKHFDAGYGEHGGRMQDDKDDGVKYLIEQGLVDPDRVAFFGWSYGGYAALVSLSREEQLYQCAIAGAAVADPEKQHMGRRNPDLKALDEWSKRRGMIGVNPMKEVAKVNIPLLMIHGDVDRRVMYYHMKDYQKAFEAAGKTGEFITLAGADHFYNTLMYKHQQQLYTKMLDYLANDCGPGGL